MNKNVLLLVFTLFSAVSLSQSSLSSRDFFNSYLGVIKGKDFSMDIDCLGNKFEDYLNDFNKAIATMDIVKLIFDMDMMMNISIQKCPFDDIRRILKDLKICLRNGTFFKNILKNFAFIESKIEKFISSNKTACEIGSCLGEITKIVIYGMGYTSWEDPHQHSSANNFLN